MGPAAGVVTWTGKIIDTRVVGLMSHKQCADGTNQEPRGKLPPRMGSYDPTLGSLIKCGVFDPGVKLNATPQIEFLGYMLQVSSHLIAGTLGFRPIPFVYQLFGKRVGVKWGAGRIDAGARVAVVPPRTTNIAGPVKPFHIQLHVVT